MPTGYFLAKHRQCTYSPSSVFQLVIAHRSELLSTECELSSVHQALSRLPQRIIETNASFLEELIERAHDLFKNYSPQKLENASKKCLRAR